MSYFTVLGDGETTVSDLGGITVAHFRGHGHAENAALFVQAASWREITAGTDEGEAALTTRLLGAVPEILGVLDQAKRVLSRVEGDACAMRDTLAELLRKVRTP